MRGNPELSLGRVPRREGPWPRSLNSALFQLPRTWRLRARFSWPPVDKISGRKTNIFPVEAKPVCSGDQQIILNSLIFFFLKKWVTWAFPGGPVVKTLHSQSRRQGFDPWSGGTNGKEPVCQYRRHKRCRLDPWVGKIPCRKAWQPTPVLLPGELHGQRSLAACSPRVT